FGEISGQSEPGRGECQAFEKAATIDRNIENSGLCGFRGFRFHRSSVFRFVGPLFCALITFAYVPSLIGLTRPSGDGDLEKHECALSNLVDVHVFSIRKKLWR